MSVASNNNTLIRQFVETTYLTKWILIIMINGVLGALMYFIFLKPLSFQLQNLTLQESQYRQNFKIKYQHSVNSHYIRNRMRQLKKKYEVMLTPFSINTLLSKVGGNSLQLRSIRPKTLSSGAMQGIRFDGAGHYTALLNFLNNLAQLPFAVNIAHFKLFKIKKKNNENLLSLNLLISMSPLAAKGLPGTTP